MSDEEPVDKKNLSQAPSWVMVGFLAGALMMWSLGDREPDPPERQPAPPPPRTAQEIMSEQPQVTARDNGASLKVVEALFSALQEWALWTEDRTEIGVWNSHTLSFSDRFEVVRLNDSWYFRPIAQFTRLPMEGYGPPNSPILFTETAEQRNRRQQQARGALAPDPNPRPPDPMELEALPRSTAAGP